MKVLVVDDQEINRKLPMAILKKYGVEVLDAEDGPTGLSLLQQYPDITHLLLDVSMPGMGGEEVCRILRARPLAPPLQIIAYTAHAFPSEKEQIMAAGFDELLIKPISRDDLLRALDMS
ncbi:response regulator [Paludibacterium yongneupense]|uniref:response regulator n=1 Tax=Paludibacterium yongneupense TaxID=400061 RepID=UPI000415C635|nr:response regulator [Paludibacterium yongneupense]